MVRAPADGFVTSVGVSAGDQARPLSPVMPFIASEGAFIAGVFRQNGMDGMPPGTPVRIVLDRKPGQIFESEVVQVAPASSSGRSRPGPISWVQWISVIRVSRLSFSPGRKAWTEPWRRRALWARPPP